MLWIEALVGLLRRSLGSVVRAIFGWATLALFGEVSSADRTWLSVAVGAAAAWPFLVVGVVFPKQAALVLALLPLPESTPASLVRGVWIGLAIATPAAVGWIMARTGTASETSRWRRLLLGFPATLGLGLAFLFACVVVPVAKLSAMLARKKEEHLALAVAPEDYESAAELMQSVLEHGGLEIARTSPPWATRVLGKVLHAFAGALLGASVPKELAFFRGPELEMTLYPNGARLLGAHKTAGRAHALIVEGAAAMPVLQCMSPEGQKLERRIRSVREQLADSAAVDRRVSLVAGALAEAELEYTDWEILYRELLQVVVAARGGEHLIERALARRKSAARAPAKPRARSGK